MRKIVRSLSLCLALALTLSRAAGADGQADSEAGLGDLVVVADTPEEHLALATKYRELAADARDRAANDVELGEHYAEAMPKSQMNRHCEKLAELNDGIAAEYEAMAAVHEKEAAR